MHLAPGLEQDSDRDVSGLLLTGLGEIWVNRAEAERWQGRARFTVGHELGHFVLHRDRLDRTIFCRTVETPDDRAGQSGPTERSEAVAVERDSELEADAFAAALLMPRHLLEPAHRACRGDVGTLMAEFGTSEKAMRYRIGHLFA
jgi:Zn-dependent peptidase ImmA (M78 family)